MIGEIKIKSNNQKWEWRADKLPAVRQAEKQVIENKFNIPADSPLIGIWKHVEYFARPSFDPGIVPPQVKSSITRTYNQNSTFIISLWGGLLSTELRGNWKYIPTNSSSGVLEEYQGDILLEKGNIRWINKNQFEYTVTDHQNPIYIGGQLTYTRQ